MKLFQNSCPLRGKNISVSLPYFVLSCGRELVPNQLKPEKPVPPQCYVKLRRKCGYFRRWFCADYGGRWRDRKHLTRVFICQRVRCASGYDTKVSGQNLWGASVETGSVETWSNVNSSRGQRKKTRSENLHHLRMFFFFRTDEVTVIKQECAFRGWTGPQACFWMTLQKCVCVGVGHDAALMNKKKH